MCNNVLSFVIFCKKKYINIFFLCVIVEVILPQAMTNISAIIQINCKDLEFDFNEKDKDKMI